MAEQSPYAAAAAAARQAMWSRFFHPETMMFYDYDPGVPGQPLLPRPDEIAARHPNLAGWFTGMENGALNSSLMLEMVCLEGDYTPEAERLPLRREAARIWMGLDRLFTVATDPGFLPRAVALDGVSHYPNSSADQYTYYVSAAVRYARSPLCDLGTRRRIGETLEAICARWERDGWVDWLEDRRGPAIFGDIGSFTPDRASRLIQALLAAATFTARGAYWRARYLEKVEEADRARLALAPHQRGRATYVAQQNQIAWRMLYDLERDGDLRAVYRDRLRETARSVVEALETFRQFDATAHQATLAETDFDWRHAYDGGPLPMDPLREGQARYQERIRAYVRRSREVRAVDQYEHRFVQESMEVAQIIALSDDEELIETHRATMRELLLAFAYERLRLSWSLYAVGFVYWLAIAPAEGRRRYP